MTIKVPQMLHAFNNEKLSDYKLILAIDETTAAASSVDVHDLNIIHSN